MPQLRMRGVLPTRLHGVMLIRGTTPLFICVVITTLQGFLFRTCSTRVFTKSCVLLLCAALCVLFLQNTDVQRVRRVADFRALPVICKASPQHVGLISDQCSQHTNYTST
jgi:hypothetical protein